MRRRCQARGDVCLLACSEFFSEAVLGAAGECVSQVVQLPGVNACWSLPLARIDEPEWADLKL